MLVNKNKSSSVARIWDYESETKILLDELGISDKVDLGKRNLASFLDKDLYFFTNPHVFREPAIHFQKYGYYCPYNKETQTNQYNAWWRREVDRCVDGIIVDNFFIPGEFYYFLNYTRMQIAHEVTGVEVNDFPRFYAVHYYIFLEYYEATLNAIKENICMLKPRRFGISYLGASLESHMFLFRGNAGAAIVSDVPEKAQETWKKAVDNIDWANQFTELSKPYLYRTRSSKLGDIEGGISTKIDGIEVTKGRKGFVTAISSHNKPEAAAGVGASLIIIEEAGMCKSIPTMMISTEHTLTDGKFWKGIMFVFGTANEGEHLRDSFFEVFKNPISYHVRKYINYFENEDEYTGLFISKLWAMPGGEKTYNGITYKTMDSNGNSLFWLVEILINEEDVIQRAEKDDEKYLLWKSQVCIFPKDALIGVQSLTFDKQLYTEALNHAKAIRLNENSRSVGMFERNNKGIFVLNDRPDLYNIEDYPLTKDTYKKPERHRGSIAVYQHPPTGNIPVDAFIAGYDGWLKLEKLAQPNRYMSLGALTIFRTLQYTHIPNPGQLVAVYVGRSQDAKDYHSQIPQLLRYYNCNVISEAAGNNELYHALSVTGDVWRMVIDQYKLRGIKGYLDTMGYRVTPANRLLLYNHVFTYLNQLVYKQTSLKYIQTILDFGVLNEIGQFSPTKGNYDRLNSMVGPSVYILDDLNYFLQNITEPKNNIDILSGVEKYINPRTYDKVRKSQ